MGRDSSHSPVAGRRASIRVFHLHTPTRFTEPLTRNRAAGGPPPPTCAHSWDGRCGTLRLVRDPRPARCRVSIRINNALCWEVTLHALFVFVEGGSSKWFVKHTGRQDCVLIRGGLIQGAKQGQGQTDNIAHTQPQHHHTQARRRPVESGRIVGIQRSSVESGL